MPPQPSGLAQRAQGRRVGALSVVAGCGHAGLHAGLFGAVGGGAIEGRGQGAEGKNHQVLSGFDRHGGDLRTDQEGAVVSIGQPGRVASIEGYSGALSHV